MRKVNLGCGQNRLSGWENYDIDMDITKPLRFEDNSVDFILNEHVIEHITQREAYNFIKEAKRVLKAGGVIRTATPSLSQIAYGETESYRKFVKSHGWGDGQRGCGVRAILFEHGHQCVYTVNTLLAMFHSLGFDAEMVRLGESLYPELRGIEGHGSLISDEFNRLETFCVEAKKPLTF